MAWLAGLLIIRRMTTGAGIGCIGIVALVAGSTVVGDSGVRTFQHIVVIMYIKGSGTPSRRCGGMAGSALV